MSARALCGWMSVFVRENERNRRIAKTSFLFFLPLDLCMHQKLDEILAHVHAHVTLFFGTSAPI